MNISPTPFQPRVLVAPLDWGLGHATRCIPIIRTLLTNGATVWLAGDGKIGHLLKTEFPELSFLPLPGYGVTYGRTRMGTLAALAAQVPKLLYAIQQETRWLQQVVRDFKIDAVISDNRYGLHHPNVFSVFITHQLLIKTPLHRTNLLLQNLVYRYINRFDACWVPDAPGNDTLAGMLSHPQKLPAVPVTYLGPLSRFSYTMPELTHYLLTLLSGPEPQRTILEEKLLHQAKLFQNPILLVRGLPGAVGVPKVPYHITIVNHLPAPTLQKAIAGAQFVISRCGHSTVMDLMILQKKCIFIPTPMQTEQEYLAQHLMQQNFALAIPQQKFVLRNAVALADSFPYRFPVVEKTDALKRAVTDLLQQCALKKEGQLQNTK